MPSQLNLKPFLPDNSQQTVNGQTLYEVIIAIGIVAIILVGAISLSTVGIRNSSFARNNSVATKYAQGGIEWLREQRDRDWDEFRGNTGRTNLGDLSWGSGSCTIPGTTFCRTMSFSCGFYNPGPPPSTTPRPCNNINVNTVDVTITVTWSDAQGDHPVRSVSTLTRWH